MEPFSTKTITTMEVHLYPEDDEVIDFSKEVKDQAITACCQRFPFLADWAVRSVAVAYSRKFITVTFQEVTNVTELL